MPLSSSTSRSLAVEDPASLPAREAPGRSSSGSAAVPGAGSSVPASSPSRTRLQRGVIQPKNYKHIAKFGYACNIHGADIVPHTIVEALMIHGGKRPWRKSAWRFTKIKPGI